MKKNREVVLVAVAAISLIGAACTKKVAIRPSPPPAPAATAPSTPARAATPMRSKPRANPDRGRASAALSECGDASAYRRASGQD